MTTPSTSLTYPRMPEKVLLPADQPKDQTPPEYPVTTHLKVTNEELVRLTRGYRTKGVNAVFASIVVGSVVLCGIALLANLAGWVDQNTMNGALAMCVSLDLIAGVSALYQTSRY